MRNKVFARLLSVVLSATMALSPSFTAFAGEGDIPGTTTDYSEETPNDNTEEDIIFDLDEEEAALSEDEMDSFDGTSKLLGNDPSLLGGLCDVTFTFVKNADVPDDIILPEEKIVDNSAGVISIVLDVPIGVYPKHVFAGWEPSPTWGLELSDYIIGSDYQSAILTSSLLDYTLTAKYLETFTVTFDGGALDASVTTAKIEDIIDGHTISPDDAPEASRPGYDFAKWVYDDDNNSETEMVEFVFGETRVTKDITVYATWEPWNYTISFEYVHGGQTPMEDLPMTVGVPKKLRKNTYEVSGYDFAGWATYWKYEEGEELFADEQEVDLIPPGKDGTIKLYARFTPRQNTVYFDAKGGVTKGKTTPPDPQLVVEGDRIYRAPIVEKAGYKETNRWYYMDGSQEKEFIFGTGDDATLVYSEMHLYVKWDSPEKYLGLFWINKGSDTTAYFPEDPESNWVAEEVTYGEAYGELPVPKSQENDFIGWFTERVGGEEVTSETIVSTAKTHNLYAHWEPKPRYTVSFNSMGGSPVPSQEVMIGNKATRPDDPQKRGYDFAGWYSDSETIEAFDFDTTGIENDTTLYAKWTGWQYKISFDANGATAGTMEDEDMVYGTPKALLSNNFAKDKYEFLGWNTKADGTGSFYRDEEKANILPTAKDAAVTLYAQWDAEVKVTLDPGDHGVFDEDWPEGQPKMIPLGKGMKLSKNDVAPPTWEGYLFDGWYETNASEEGYDITKPLDITKPFYTHAGYTAKWIEEHLVTFNDGENETVITVGDGYTINVEALPADPTREGYRFNGWFTSVDGQKVELDITKPVTENAVYTAEWFVEHTVIFYDGVAATPVKTLKMSDGQKIDSHDIPETPHKTGGIFVGWFTSEGNELDISVPVTANATYTAKWLKNLTIQFNANGGLFGEVDVKTTETIEGMVFGPAISNVPSKTGYKFEGWASSSDATEPDYDQFENKVTKVEDDNKEFYAVWDPIEYTVVFDANGGSGPKMDNKTFSYGAPNKILDKSTYTSLYNSFAGWTTKKLAPNSPEIENYLVPTFNEVTRRTVISADYNLTEKDGATVTLYAAWKGLGRDVTTHYGYDTSTGANVPGSEEVKFLAYGTPISSAITYPAGGWHKGYYFDGWYKEEDFKTKVDISKAYKADFTDLYAKWVPATINVTYHSNLPTDATVKASYNYKASKDSTGRVTIRGVFAGNKAWKDIEKALLDKFDPNNDDPDSYGNMFGNQKGWYSSWNGFDPDLNIRESEFVEAVVSKYHELNPDAASMPKTISVDLYARWLVDPEKTYKIAFVATKDAPGTEYVEADYPLDEILITDVEGYGYVDSVNADETIIITGNEFIRKGYSLTGFSYMDGTKKKTLKAGSSVKNLPWVLAGEEKVAFLTAEWSKNEITYPVTFVSNGGKLKAGDRMPRNYKYSEGFRLPVMEKKGYDFNGWFEDGEFSGASIPRVAPGTEYGPLTYYAKFTPHTYTVKLTLSEADSNAGAFIDGEGVILATYDSEYKLSDDAYLAEFAGRTFKNWKVTESTDPAVKTKTLTTKQSIKNLSAVNGAVVTLEAVFTENSYAISYNYDGGKAAAKGKYPKSYKASQTEGTNSVEITNPVKAGYRFLGWDINGDDKADIVSEWGETACIITGRHEKLALKAIWKDNNYTINFYSKGSPRKTYTLRYKNIINDNVVTGAEIAEAALSVEKDKKCIVGFAASGGAAKAQYTSAKDYKLSDFLSLANSYNTIDLYAVEGKNEIHYITYKDMEGATLSKAVYTYTTNDKKDIALVTAKKTGYTFMGWIPDDPDYLVMNGNYAVKIRAGAEEDIVLTAVFEALSYSVTVAPGVKGVWDVNGIDVSSKGYILSRDVSYETGEGTDGGDLRINYDDLPKWFREGYEQVGWALDTKGTKRISSLSKLTTKKAITIYPVWKPVTSEILLLTDAAIINSDLGYLDVKEQVSAAKAVLLKSGKLVEDLDRTYGVYNTAVTLPKLSVPGFTFLGWFDVNASDAAVKKTTKGDRAYVTQILKTNTRSIHLRPYFTENSYKVMINPNGGMIKDTKTGKYVKKAVVLCTVSYREAIQMDSIDAYFTGYDRKTPFISLDRAGKNTSFADSGLVAKNNGSVTLFLQWTKNDAPVKPVISLASLISDTLMVSTKQEAVAPNTRIYVQCSSSPKFTNDVSEGYITSGNAYTFADMKSTAYYVRAKQEVRYPYGLDGSDWVSGAYSSTVRVTKPADEVTITFDPNTTDSGVVIEPSTMVIPKNFAIGELPKATREDFSLEGWYLDQALTQKVTTDSRFSTATTLYAKWVMQINIKNKKEGEAPTVADSSMVMIQDGAIIASGLETPSMDYYSFAGWYKDDSCITPIGSDEVSSSLDYDTVYAKWVPKTYTITFDSNRPEGALPVYGSMDPQTITYNAKDQKLNTLDFWIANRSFKGWATSPNGNVVFGNQEEITTQITRDITLYALW